jgi:hypothetical protein
VKRGRYLASDILVLEELLGKGALYIEKGVLVLQRAYKLLLGYLIHLTILEERYEVMAWRRALYGQVLE